MVSRLTGSLAPTSPDLLAHELVARERFVAVEAKIHRGRSGLQAVEKVEAGEVVDVVTGKAAEETELRRQTERWNGWYVCNPGVRLYHAGWGR